MLQVTGFVIYFGEILPNDALFRNFYDGKEQLVVLDCGLEWLEEEVCSPCSQGGLKQCRTPPPPIKTPQDLFFIDLGAGHLWCR